MNTCKAEAWTAMSKLSRIWKASLKLVMNSNLVFSEPLLKPYYYCMVVSAGPYNHCTRMLTRKALNISYKDHVPNVTLYGSLPPIRLTLRRRRLQFAGRWFIQVDEPIHSILFFEPFGTFSFGGHGRKAASKPCCMTGPHSVSDLLQSHGIT